MGLKGASSKLPISETGRIQAREHDRKLESVFVLGVVQVFWWKPCEIGVFHSPPDIEKSVGSLIQSKISIMSPWLNPFRPQKEGNSALLHIGLHTHNTEQCFSITAAVARKYISHISEAKCLGQTRIEIKYTLCHLIWQLSFQAIAQRSTHAVRLEKQTAGATRWLGS